MTGAFMRHVGGMASVHAAILHKLPGIVHAFSTRQGGVSQSPFATLNLGLSVGDEPLAVEENRRRFFGGFGIDPGRVVRARQVHGNGILRVDAALTERAGFPHCLVEEPAEFDALMTSLPGLALVVSTADCLPIVIYDPVRPAVAAVHAGWRGTAQRIAAQAVSAMSDAYGTDPGDCIAAIGPGIRKCCFEVDAPVVEAMARVIPTWEAHAEAVRPKHWLMDLPGINRAILEGAGLRREQIEDVRLCTACRTDLFFSHRADKGRTGRMMNFIFLHDEGREPRT
jgi:polyphenol oxidase